MDILCAPSCCTLDMVITFFPYHLPVDLQNIFTHFSSCLCVRKTAVGHLGGPGWLCVCRKVVSVETGVAIGFILLDGKQFPQPQLGIPNNLVVQPISGAGKHI